jgi:hypothetical protein
MKRASTWLKDSPVKTALGTIHAWVVPRVTVVDHGDEQMQVRPSGDNMTVALQRDITLNEGVTYDLILIGRSDDRSLKLLALTVPVEIQTGEVATPAAVSETCRAEARGRSCLDRH